VPRIASGLSSHSSNGSFDGCSDIKSRSPEGSVIQPSKNRTFASRGETDFRLLLYRFEGAEVRVEDLAVANHVSLRQNREPTLRVPRGLDVEFFTGFEIVGQLSEEFVSDETTFVVWKSILTSFVDPKAS